MSDQEVAELQERICSASGLTDEQLDATLHMGGRSARDHAFHRAQRLEDRGGWDYEHIQEAGEAVKSLFIHYKGETQ